LKRHSKPLPRLIKILARRLLLPSGRALVRIATGTICRDRS
jgi:hypothetical protein